MGIDRKRILRKRYIIVLCCVLMLAVTLLSGCGGGTGSGAPDAVSCRWVKGSFDDGTMCVYAEDAIPGTWTDPSGTVSDGLLFLGRTNDEFYASVGDGERNTFWNPEDDPIDIEAVLTFRSSGQSESFTGTMPSGEDIIWFGLSSKSYLDYALNGFAEGGSSLAVTLPNGSVFEFVLPSGSEYHDIVEKAAPAMKIPVYSDGIYEGDGVNPDLKSFFREFVPVFNAEVEYWAENDGMLGSVMQLLEISPHEDFVRLWRQYEYMNPLPRDADAEFYAEYARQINQIVGVRSLKSSWTVVEGCMDALDKMADAISGR